ncbi:hypothetical protein ETAA8_17420 [Anatilimnocola aggregata]|uniref:Secreted protein n=1 Tax=Anatilimnocola aggregata TaxID=2528021 RepID=A0A517Y8Y1_9BACT|nr:hypothetical protein [Anatilimnocola aggregata]QDU26661.1 hypothetical protein ETAA8_17420 [Anatilimnocola aggregata]
MIRQIASILLLSVAVLGVTAGCNQNSNPPAANPPASGGNVVGPSDMEKMKAELAKLSPEDAASAEKQHVCLVTDKMLGTMGPPLKVDVDGKPIWICCEGCRDEVLANKDTYLAKLKKE